MSKPPQTLMDAARDMWSLLNQLEKRDKPFPDRVRQTAQLQLLLDRINGILVFQPGYCRIGDLILGLIFNKLGGGQISSVDWGRVGQDNDIIKYMATNRNVAQDYVFPVPTALVVLAKWVQEGKKGGSMDDLEPWVQGSAPRLTTEQVQSVARWIRVMLLEPLARGQDRHITSLSLYQNAKRMVGVVKQSATGYAAAFWKAAKRWFPGTIEYAQAAAQDAAQQQAARKQMVRKKRLAKFAPI